MLSGETAKGAYPTQTVDMMSKICRDAEMAINYDVLYNMIKDSTPECGPDESVACAAVKCATEQVHFRASSTVLIGLHWHRVQNAKAIITMTTSGRTARLLAKYRPACPILPVSKDDRSARQVRVRVTCGAHKAAQRG
jgi:pyruvate kinase